MFINSNLAYDKIYTIILFKLFKMINKSLVIIYFMNTIPVKIKLI